MVWSLLLEFRYIGRLSSGAVHYSLLQEFGVSFSVVVCRAML